MARSGVIGRAAVACAMLAAAGASATCGGTSSLITATEVPEAARRPDGVLLEPPAAVPSPSVAASARGVVALREPRDDEAIRELLLTYVRGFAREDLELLKGLLTSDAVQLGPRAHVGREALIESWKQRLRSLDYAKASTVDVLRLERMERFGPEQLGASGDLARPAEMRAGDVLVRVPVATPRIGSERLFGDAIILLVRGDEDGLRIAGVYEEDGP